MPKISEYDVVFEKQPDQTCKHLYEYLTVVRMSCGFVDAFFIRCTKCGNYLYGLFLTHDDNSDIPSAIYDKEWYESPDGFDRSSPKCKQLPKTRERWDPNIVPLIPKSVRLCEPDHASSIKKSRFDILIFSFKQFFNKIRAIIRFF